MDYFGVVLAVRLRIEDSVILRRYIAEHVDEFVGQCIVIVSEKTAGQHRRCNTICSLTLFAK